MADLCTRCKQPRNEDRWMPGALRAGLCHSCTFWTEKVDMRDDPRTIRHEGCHYYDDGNRPHEHRKGFLGCGGTRWRIEMADGRVIVTNNLWCQGGIPADWQGELPDNCTSIVEVRP